jgi:membrane-bound ClpP family serine protease
LDRWGWLAFFADPVFLAGLAASIVVPLLLLPPPAGPAVSIALVAALLWLNYRLEISISRLPVQNGLEGMIGRSASVVETLGPIGLVQCGGEMWRAREVRGQRVESGRRVRVVGVRRLELQVERL